MVRTKESKAKGFFFGILAAVSYGVNPLGAKYLYEEGLNVESVLFYRYGLAALIIGMIMAGKMIAEEGRFDKLSDWKRVRHRATFFGH